jgi:hypothetical protein
MAKFYWIGQTLSTSTSISAFSWNNKKNWRELPPGRQAEIIRTKTDAATRVPGHGTARDEVYIGLPIADVNGNPLKAYSPLLFGGCTGTVTPEILTQGQTWEHGGITNGVDVYISGSTQAYVFNNEYPFPVIGGGITGGGQGYWNSFTEFKNWAISRYNIVNTNDINTIFSDANLNSQPNKNQLKVKAFTVTEDFKVQDGNPVLVSMQIPKTCFKGTTLAATEYIKRGKNMKTLIQNSVVNKISNIASLVIRTNTDTGEIGLPEPTGNNLTVNNSIVHRYEGYYDDSVTIKSNAKVTSAQVFSPVPATALPDSYGFAGDGFGLKFAGKYGAYYTSAYLGTIGAPRADDGTLSFDDTRDPGLGSSYHPTYQIRIGEEGTGITCAYKVITATNNTVVFVGKNILQTYESDHCYTVNDSKMIDREKDLVNIVTYNMRNGSSLDMSYNAPFDRWFFGSLPAGETLVQGGIIAYGLTNKLYGSAGVALYNEVVLATVDFKTRTGGKPINRTETNIGTSDTPETNLA